MRRYPQWLAIVLGLAACSSEEPSDDSSSGAPGMVGGTSGDGGSTSTNSGGMLSGGMSSGGAARGGSASGGMSSGGASRGGSGNAGVSSGGAGRGGSGNAGSASGGVATGGSATGGMTSAGSANGGMPSGGTGPGGSADGGTTIGGSGTGGSAEGGISNAGTGTGGSDLGGTESGGSAQAGEGSGGEPPGPWPPSDTFANPVIWNDLADEDVIRVGDIFYFTASNMHYSPGAPILRSWDLVNWEYAGHAVPVLDFSDKYNLVGGQAYIKGTWASTMRYRESDQTFYWLGCIEFGRTYVYTAPAVEGPWEKHPAINNCYYDAGLLIDDDDTIYVSYGNTDISVAQLSADGTSQVRAEQVYSSSNMTIEGSHFYKHDGDYFIIVTRPADGQFVLRSSEPFGEYTIRTLIDRNSAPIQGAGVPHQGSFVETQNGDWYYLAFVDAYPGGRIPVLAPLTWDSEGWPVVELVNDGWAASYPYPDVPRPPQQTKPYTGTDSFEGPSLGHEWEWNHNPDDTKWSANGGLTLQTATVTDDLYAARNTLTHRILGPQSAGTIELDISGMADGDVAGLALLRHFSAWVGIKKSGDSATVVMVDGLSMDGSWNTTSTGTEVESQPLSGDTVWLRLDVDIRPGSGRQGSFSFSTDGTSFTPIGRAYTMNTSWEFFMGYRFGIFNYATRALGGAVTVRSFDLSTP